MPDQTEFGGSLLFSATVHHHSWRRTGSSDSFFSPFLTQFLLLQQMNGIYLFLLDKYTVAGFYCDAPLFSLCQVSLACCLSQKRVSSLLLVLKEEQKWKTIYKREERQLFLLFLSRNRTGSQISRNCNCVWPDEKNSHGQVPENSKGFFVCELEIIGSQFSNSFLLFLSSSFDTS